MRLEQYYGDFSEHVYEKRSFLGNSTHTNHVDQGAAELFTPEQAEQGFMTTGLSACWALILHNTVTDHYLFAHVDWDDLKRESVERVYRFLNAAQNNEQIVNCCKIGWQGNSFRLMNWEETPLGLRCYLADMIDRCQQISPLWIDTKNRHLAVKYSSQNGGTLFLNTGGIGNEQVHFYVLTQLWQKGLAALPKFLEDSTPRKPSP